MQFREFPGDLFFLIDEYILIIIYYYLPHHHNFPFRSSSTSVATLVNTKPTAIDPLTGFKIWLKILEYPWNFHVTPHHFSYSPISEFLHCPFVSVTTEEHLLSNSFTFVS